MAKLSALPAEMIEEIFKQILTDRHGDDCPEDFLAAISFLRTCRMMRDIGMKVLFPATTRFKYPQRRRSELMSLERAIANWMHWSPNAMFEQLRNLEMRCLSRIMPDEEYSRRLEELYQPLIEQTMDEAPHIFDFYELSLRFRLEVISGKRVEPPAWVVRRQRRLRNPRRRAMMRM